MPIRQRSFAIMLLLSIVTCGIYTIYFWYCWNEDVNRVCASDGRSNLNYILVLLLSIITCGIYYFVWMYQQQERLYQVAAANHVFNVKSGSTVLLWYILGAFVVVGPLIAEYQMIDAMNLVGNAYNQTLGSYGPPPVGGFRQQ